jgi:hypothetical protein
MRLAEGRGPVFAAFPLSLCPISIVVFRRAVELRSEWAHLQAELCQLPGSYRSTAEPPRLSPAQSVTDVVRIWREPPDVGYQAPVPFPTPHASDKADQLIGLSAQHHHGAFNRRLSRVVVVLHQTPTPCSPPRPFTFLSQTSRSLVDFSFPSHNTTTALIVLFHPPPCVLAT